MPVKGLDTPQILGKEFPGCSASTISQPSSLHLDVVDGEAGSKSRKITLPETKSLPLKIGHPKRKGSYSNHPFSGLFAANFREGSHKK